LTLTDSEIRMNITMKVSGFTFIRDGIKLDFPFIESIRSILPVCDEFIVNVGDSSDGTLEAVEGINDPKIKVINSNWDEKLFVKGKINAVETNRALSHCEGDWAFYLQADEVVHEKWLPVVLEAMRDNLNDTRIQGLLFDYVHFWGDYYRYQIAHGWYTSEVRIIRNKIGIQSWSSAQGFRLNEKKLLVAHTGAEIYHYGWVRDPSIMLDKQKALNRLHHGSAVTEEEFRGRSFFNYGSLEHLAKFKGTHPSVMKERIAGKSWEIPDSAEVNPEHRHNRLSIRFLSWFERNVFHRTVFERGNYKLKKSGHIPFFK